MSIVYIDLAGPLQIPMVRGEEKLIKVWLLMVTCSWSRFLKIQLMTEISSQAVVTSLETAMNSVGCSMPAVVYCDRGTQLLPLEQLQKERCTFDQRVTAEANKLFLAAAADVKTNDAGANAFAEIFEADILRAT